MTGMARRTRAESVGLVTTISAMAPRKRKTLRSAIEALAPKADLICVVSAVSRETISPLRGWSKKAGIEAGQMREDVASGGRRRCARRAS